MQVTRVARLLAVVRFHNLSAVGLVSCLTMAGLGATQAAAEPAAPAEPRDALAEFQSSLASLNAVRDELAARLETRLADDAKAGPSYDLILRLSEGADHEEMHATLRLRGGQWLGGYAAVPAWRQESFQDKFRYYHRGGIGEVLRDKFRFPIDAAAVKFDGQSLRGTMTAGLRLDETRDERMPPGTPVRWKNTGERFTQMEIMDALVHHKPRPQRYTLEAAVRTGVHEFALTLHRGIPDHEVEVAFQVPALPWVNGVVRARTFNGGFHALDATGLTYANGVLQGALKVTFNPDAWFPKKPMRATYQLRATVEDSRCTGRFQASGDHGAFEGALSGQAGAFVEGRYQAEGALGSCRSLVHGRIQPVRVHASALLGKTPPLPQQPDEAAQALADEFSRAYREVRALHLALRQYPLPLEEALRQTETAGPTWGEDRRQPLSKTDLASMVDYIRRLVAVAKTAASAKENADFVQGTPAIADATFGPYCGSRPLEAAQEKPYALPAAKGAAGSQRWCYLPAWHVLGPLQRVDDRDHNLAELPDAIPALDARYAARPGRPPKEKPAGQPKGRKSDRKPKNLKPADDKEESKNTSDTPESAKDEPEPGKASAEPNAAEPKNDTGEPKKDSRPLCGWQVTESPRGKLEPPWSKGHDRGANAGSVWLAYAEIASSVEREIWISVAAADHGKLWLNGRLVWISDEVLWRTHNRREAIFKVRLREGVNQLLARCREDRGETWLRLHLGIESEPRAEAALAAEPRPAAPPRTVYRDSRGDGGGRFPDAQPPLAWDLEKGINVAWRKSLPHAIRSGPVAVAGRLFVCASPHHLYCLDQKTGEILWQRETNVLELLDQDALAKWQACQTAAEKEGLLKQLRLPSDAGPNSPISDGQAVWALHDTGVAAAYSLAGERQWIAPINLAGAAMVAFDGKLVIEGGNRKSPTHTLMLLDAKTGGVAWKKELPGECRRGQPWVVRMRRGDATRTAILDNSLRLLDAATGDVLLDTLDVDPSPGSSVYAADDCLYFGKLSETYGVRFLLDPAGHVGHRFLWQNHYGIKYDRPVACFVLGDWFMTGCTVQEDCKGHSNAPYQELYFYDRHGGAPVKRLKPVLSRAQNESPPTSAGHYVFIFDSGGGASGGHPTHGQMAVVDAAGTPRLVCQNLLELGTGATPVFDGDKMFLRRKETITCVAVTTPKGRTYQEEKIAEAMFDALRDPPRMEEYAQVIALDQPPDPRNVPVARLISDEGIIHWLAAGPFPFEPAGQSDEVLRRLSGLRPENGTPLQLAGMTLAFHPVPQSRTASSFSYGHSYYLCGLGGTVAQLTRTIEVSACTGGKTDACGFLYTVVDNSRQRVALLIAPAVGLDIWLGGRKIRAFDAVRLKPGAYPLLIRVRPDYFPGEDRITLCFREMDDPQIVRPIWLSKVNDREAELQGAARMLTGSPWSDKAARFLEALDEFKTWRDLASRDRGLRNDGSGRFANARPPVPWQRDANVLWATALPAAASAPVAAGERIFVAMAPSRLLCLSDKDGRVLWEATVGGAAQPGSAPAVPAVAGERVVVASGGGNVVCLRADGTNAWSVTIPDALPGGEQSPAVAVAGGVAIVQLSKLHGLALESGKVLWSVESGAKGPLGPPLSVAIGSQPVLVTCGGRIINTTDGKPLVEGLPACGPVSPHAQDDVLYLAPADRPGDLVAYRLPSRLVAGHKLASAWETKWGRPVTAGPLVHQGLVYVLLADQELYALEATNGKEVYRQKLAAFANRQPVNCDLLLAGHHLYVTNLGDDYRTLVLKPGRQFAKVWEYAVPGACAAPFFLARNQYIAAGKTLFGIGGLAPRDPGPYRAPMDVGAPAGFTPAPGAPLNTFESNAMPPQWLLAGPLKTRSLETDFLASIGGRDKAQPSPGTRVKYEGAETSFRPVDKNHCWRDPKFTAGFDAVSVLDAAGREMNSTVYLYTVLVTDEPRLAELQVLTPDGIRWNTKERVDYLVWIGGKPAPEGEVVRLPKGPVPVMIQVALGNLTEGGKIWLAPRLIDRTAAYAADHEKHARQLKTWQAYQQTAHELFVLKP